MFSINRYVSRINRIYTMKCPFISILVLYLFSATALIGQVGADPGSKEKSDATAKNGATDSTIYTFVEIMPEFPGGEENLRKYLKQLIRYPDEARKNGIEGKVYITFMVEANGHISNVKVLRGIKGGCDEEAVRVIKEMPPWQPGKNKGRPVRVQYSMPVIFQLTK